MKYRDKWVESKKARKEILAAANELRAKNGAKALHNKNINQAVRICRFNRLVSSETLVAAGFNG